MYTSTSVSDEAANIMAWAVKPNWATQGNWDIGLTVGSTTMYLSEQDANTILGKVAVAVANHKKQQREVA